MMHRGRGLKSLGLVSCGLIFALSSVTGHAYSKGDDYELTENYQQTMGMHEEGSAVTGYGGRGTATVSVGRYSSMVAEATEQQADLLKALIQTRFHQRIITVGEAIQYLLLRSGYQLAEVQASDPGVAILMSRPLPEVHRELGPMTLEEALLTLASPVYRLVVDPLNRLISFEVVSQYRSLVPEFYDNIELLQGEAYSPGYKDRLDGVITGEHIQDHVVVVPPVREVEPLEYDNEIIEHQDSVTTFDLSENNSSAKEALADLESSLFQQTEYGPVQPTDTLYKIAGHYATALEVDTNVVAMGLFQNNPKAFGRVQGDKNMNQLFQGAFMQVPTKEQLKDIQAGQAMAMVATHNQAWIAAQGQ